VVCPCQWTKFERRRNRTVPLFRQLAAGTRNAPSAYTASGATGSLPPGIFVHWIGHWVGDASLCSYIVAWNPPALAPQAGRSPDFPRVARLPGLQHRDNRRKRQLRAEGTTKRLARQ